MTKSKIFLFFCLAFILGVFIESLLNLRLIYWLGILILGVMMAAIFWARAQKIAVVGFCLMMLVAGAWRFISLANPANTVKEFNDKGKIVFQGTIDDEPDVRSDNVRYRVAVDSYKFIGTSSGFLFVQGDILVVAKKYPPFNYGDRVEINGKLATPKSSADFDYQKYLAKDDIYSVIYYPEIKLVAAGQGNFIKGKLFWLKNKFENSLNQILTEPQASLLAGLLLGEKRGFSPELMDNFSRTGTTHIVALSGYNITVIAVALAGLFNFFMLRRSVSFWLAILVILLFVVMTGASASAVRAAVMGILVLVAQQAGRLYSIRNALVFAGALMIYLNPKVLTFDLGFQLSFAATLGLVYISPILQEWFTLKEESDFTLAWITKKTFVKSLKSLKNILVATLAAQIAVLPLLVINFGRLSLIAPLANVLILLFIPTTMFFGFLAGLAGIFWLGFGKILGWVAWLLLTYEIKAIEFLARVPLAALKFKWSWWGGGVYYLLLIYFIWYFSRRYQKTLINAPVVKEQN
jgi:competence protein ComEC